jgi:hypothetical protein
MNSIFKDLMEENLISEPEIVDLIQVTHKLTKLNIMSQEDLDNLCLKLGVTQIGENVFQIDENSEYTFN